MPIGSQKRLREYTQYVRESQNVSSNRLRLISSMLFCNFVHEFWFKYCWTSYLKQWISLFFGIKYKKTPNFWLVVDFDKGLGTFNSMEFLHE